MIFSKLAAKCIIKMSIRAPNLNRFVSYTYYSTIQITIFFMFSFDIYGIFQDFCCVIWYYSPCAKNKPYISHFCASEHLSLSSPQIYLDMPSGYGSALHFDMNETYTIILKFQKTDKFKINFFLWIVISRFILVLFFRKKFPCLFQVLLDTKPKQH